jgi:hypothetical protein
LARAARRDIDEITMWYLGSVPHQPDVRADGLVSVRMGAAGVVADVP